MEETREAIITKNGKNYHISLNKIWTLWIMIGSFITVITAIVTWFLSMETFKNESIKDRTELRKFTIQNQQMIIEVNYNLRDYLSNRKKFGEDINWKTYAEIKDLLKIN